MCNSLFPPTANVQLPPILILKRWPSPFIPTLTISHVPFTSTIHGHCFQTNNAFYFLPNLYSFQWLWVYETVRSYVYYTRTNVCISTSFIIWLSPSQLSQPRWSPTATNLQYIFIHLSILFNLILDTDYTRHLLTVCVVDVGKSKIPYLALCITLTPPKLSTHPNHICIKSKYIPLWT